MVFTNNEPFNADVEVAHFGASGLGKSEFICQVTDEKGAILRKEILSKDTVTIGNCIPVGHFQMDLSEIKNAQRLTFEISLMGTSFKNRWNIWVYPAEININEGNVIITDRLDGKTEEYLKQGRSILFLSYGSIAKNKGADVAIGYSTVFWNTAWTGNQPPHTMGILCDPEHAAFKGFPTESHTDAQWWDAVTRSQVMILDGFAASLVPLIQPIDTWFENRRLALAFEARVGEGRLIVCSIDLKTNIDERPSTKQLAASIIDYMNSNSFHPKTDIGLDTIRSLLK